MKRLSPVGIVLLLTLTLLLAGCAAGANPQEGQGANPAGFWLGLWQGLICPITFIVSLFTDTVSIYEVDNNGNWYDFGFVLGIFIAFSGMGGSAGASSSRRRG
ncbi:MAG TPA: hypothetical protein VK204_17465 [Nocardioidaceae bacterium]|nr:hypothetical protein [Nocardioidaceae bacterium]